MEQVFLYLYGDTLLFEPMNTMELVYLPEFHVFLHTGHPLSGPWPRVQILSYEDTGDGYTADAAILSFIPSSEEQREAETMALLEDGACTLTRFSFQKESDGRLTLCGFALLRHESVEGR